MDYETLSKLDKEFSEQAQEMTKEFSELFEKWKKRSLRLSVVMAIHMPINNILNMLNLDKQNVMQRLFEDLPDVFIRFLTPFVKIKNQWGKVSSEEFVKMYAREYENQFSSYEDLEKQIKAWREGRKNNLKLGKKK